MLLLTYKTLIVAHILVGVVGLVAFWGPVLTRKGSSIHRRWGFVFAGAMMATGSLATGIAVTSILDPLKTHPDFLDAALARGLFGWLMAFLAVFTVSLGYHALATIRHKANPAALREPIGVGLQCAVIVAALNCAHQGWLLGQPLMMALPVIGITAALTTLHFIFNPAPTHVDFLMEHIKSGIGAGISAYNAFLSVGLVRLAPDQAFNPLVWAAPIVIGVSLILVHWQRVWFGPLRRAVRG
jgi:succinate dehydrogenase/fumarate reductase cytochrome b subunit